MLQKKPIKQHRFVHFASFIILIALSVMVFYYRQRIIDQIVVWQFEPSRSVIELADRLDFNDEGEFLFYAGKPQLSQAVEFNNSCSKIEHTTSILGCFDGLQIFIYNVEDERLNGVREVTAAHEMLHVAYARLGEYDKSKLESLLDIEYAKMANDEKFLDLMSFYDRTEPGQKYNELHSIVGTVALDISPELEGYYAQYFENREKIVAFNDAYNGVFNDLNKKAEDLAKKLDELSTTIEADSEEYNDAVQTLNSNIKAFNEKARSGFYNTLAQFNNDKYALESRTYYLSFQLSDIKANIEIYNQTLAEYNSTVIESQSLYQSIDSTLVETESI